MAHLAAGRFSLPPGLELKVLEPLRTATATQQRQALSPQTSTSREVAAAVAGNARDNSGGSGLMKLFGNEVRESGLVTYLESMSNSSSQTVQPQLSPLILGR